jgi:hypothetical protein
MGLLVTEKHIQYVNHFYFLLLLACKRIYHTQMSFILKQ